MRRMASAIGIGLVLLTAAGGLLLNYQANAGAGAACSPECREKWLACMHILSGGALQCQGKGQAAYRSKFDTCTLGKSVDGLTQEEIDECEDEAAVAADHAVDRCMDPVNREHDRCMKALERMRC